ncbi:MAG: hypothetical protein AB1665_00965 [Candidatus Thermoplasmatota archaeon]
MTEYVEAMAKELPGIKKNLSKKVLGVVQTGRCPCSVDSYASVSCTSGTRMSGQVPQSMQRRQRRSSHSIMVWG